MNLILSKYFTLYIIYKKLAATPRKKQNDPLGGRDPQVKNHCPKVKLSGLVESKCLSELASTARQSQSKQLLTSFLFSNELSLTLEVEQLLCKLREQSVHVMWSFTVKQAFAQTIQIGWFSILSRFCNTITETAFFKSQTNYSRLSLLEPSLSQ